MAVGSNRRTDGRKRAPYFRPVLTISNNHRGVLDEMVAFMETGKVYVHREADERWRQAHVLHVKGPPLLPVLLRLQPLLIVKGEQASIAIEFIERRAIQRTRPLSEIDFDLVRRIRTANNRSPQKGSAITPLPHKLLGLP